MGPWVGVAQDIPDKDNALKGHLYWASSQNIEEAIGSVDYVTGIVEIDLSRCSGGLNVITSDTTTTASSEAGNDIIRTTTSVEYPSENAWFRIGWKDEMATGNTRQTLRLSAPEAAQNGVSKGMVREGKNTFVAFADENSSGTYDEGEPYGVAENVDVGWFGTSCAIELSRMAPQFARVPLTGSGEAHVRVVRVQLNEEETVSQDILLDRLMNITEHPLLTEANLLETGAVDLDWGSVTDAWTSAGGEFFALTSATYRVVTGENALGGTPFTVRFEQGMQQTAANPVDPKVGGRVCAGSPTFRWTHEARDAAGFKVKDYPAFRLRVWQEGESDGEPMYDSGVQKAPARNSSGVYEWTAPIYAGMVTAPGKEFKPMTNYVWAVSMLDAKFTEPNSGEKKSAFMFACSGDIRDGNGYGKIDVRVKYFGPLAERISVTNTCLANLVRVQAFESPDFTGTPAGEAYVKVADDIASISNLTVNATILGILPGDYYLRAFLDTDADGDWSTWETWGYCNYVGTEEKFVYTPRVVTVAADTGVAAATIYMEDVDTNNNGVSDAYEWFENGGVLGYGQIMIWYDQIGVTALPECEGTNETVSLNLRMPRQVATNDVEVTLTSLLGNAVPEIVGGTLTDSTMSENGDVVIRSVYTLPATNEIQLTRLDGTMGAAYTIKVAVSTNDVENLDYTIDPGEFSFNVTNVAPTIEYVGGKGCDSPKEALKVVPAWFGRPFEITNSVSDVEIDLKAGLKVYWMGEGLVGVNNDLATVSTNELGYLVTNGVMTVVTNAGEQLAFKLCFGGGKDGIRAATLVVEDKDGGVTKRDFWYYVTGPRDDYDNDGLANSLEEWLEGNSIYPDVSYTNRTTVAKVPDYFLRPSGMNKYLGEIFTDHDFMEDLWEDLFDPEFVSRMRFDAWDDPDQDGWSNYAELRAGSDPTRIAKGLPDAEQLFECPVPTVRMKAMYANSKAVSVSADLVVKAYGAGGNGAATAVWKVPMTAQQSFTRNLGINTGEMLNLTLGLGAVVPGTVNVEFRDLNTLSHTSEGSSWMHPSETPWQLGLVERPIDDSTAHLARGAAGMPVGTVDYNTGVVKLDLSKMQDYLYAGEKWGYGEPSADEDWIRLNLSQSYVRISWSAKVISSEDKDRGRTWETLLAMPNVSGRLREGLTMFEVFADVDKNGSWTPGEPYGVVTDVDVGWSAAEFAIELTDTTPQLTRIDLRSAVAAQGFAAQNVLTDRGIHIDGYGSNVEVPEGTNMPSQTATDVRVRIAVQAVNGRENYKANTQSLPTYPTGVFLDERINLAANGILSEKDLLTLGKYDLGWGSWSSFSNQMTRLWPTLSFASLTNMAFRIVLGDGDINSANTNNSLAVGFVNTYDLTQPTNTLASLGVVRTQPTFTWTCNSAIGKSYPAFRLQVYSASSGGSPVYDSGVRCAPPRNLDGSYSWTAPLYPNMRTPQGSLFKAGTYWWAVSMLDTKFPAPLSTQTRSSFTLAPSGAVGTVGDYGAIKACVRYYGPATTATGTLKNMIYVQAFETPDFTGMPVGEAYVTNLAHIASINDATSYNALINAIKPGTYYIRAFLDTDGDAKWSRWETWGYANYVGTDMKMLYTPRPVTVSVDMPAPAVTIFMEDMDTDHDNNPDATEGASLSTAPSADNPFYQVNPSLMAAMPRAASDTADQQSGASITLTQAMQMVTPPVAEVLEKSVEVRIDSFSLADGVTLTVSSDLTPGDYGAIVVTENATVNLYLVAAKTPDFADAKEELVKTGITIKANDETKAVVSAAELKAAIERAGLGDAAFFKVRLESAQ